MARNGSIDWLQFQLDVYGEIMDAMHPGVAPDENAWRVERALTDYLEAWNEPDNGIWEMRGPKRQNICWETFRKPLAISHWSTVLFNLSTPGPASDRQYS